MKTTGSVGEKWYTIRENNIMKTRQIQRIRNKPQTTGLNMYVVNGSVNKSKMVTVKAKTLFQLIKEGAKQKSKKVVIEFYPAYDSRVHSNLPERLKKELKKSKVETFDIIEEGQAIIALTKSKDVKSIKWEAPSFFD